MKALLLTFLLIVLLLACGPENEPPIAGLTSFPSTGDTTDLFEFNAGNSIDDDGLKVALSYRWDFNGDSVWDTDSRTDNSIGHSFIIPGTYRVQVEVSDFEGLTDTASVSITVFGRNKNTGNMTDPRDGQVYRTVKIMDSWWMAENLRYGITIDKSLEQKNNDTVEMYRWSMNQGDTLGGSYRWQEAIDYNLESIRGICPPGWHLPGIEEWSSLNKGFPDGYGYRYYGNDGLSGLNLNIANNIMRSYSGRESTYYWYCNGFWSSGFQNIPGKIIPAILLFDWGCKGVTVGYSPQSGPENNQSFVGYLSVRCIKD